MTEGRAITPKKIKTINRQLIYSYIYRQKKVSQQDIAIELKLSRPTVTSNLNELEREGLIRRNGQISSDLIGRKATAYSIEERYRIAIGMEITDHECKVVMVDLYGRKIYRNVLSIPYETGEIYVAKVCGYINGIVDSLPEVKGRILGIGIAVQGLVSPDGTRIVYGKIQNNTGVHIDSFQKHFEYPCIFVHDSESTAITELWESPEIENAFFMMLSVHLGAAHINNGMVNTGMHGHMATIEHIRVADNGRKCYCGRTGCMETVLSMQALLDGDQEEIFFERLREGCKEEVERWERYLKSLASIINNLHLIYDEVFMLSGYLAGYITEKDIRFLYDYIREIKPFEEKEDFIRICKMPKHSITIGAALPYIRAFIDDIAG